MSLPAGMQVLCELCVKKIGVYEALHKMEQPLTRRKKFTEGHREKF
jgi:hypothetical protein